MLRIRKLWQADSRRKRLTTLGEKGPPLEPPPVAFTLTGVERALSASPPPAALECSPNVQ